MINTATKFGFSRLQNWVWPGIATLTFVSWLPATGSGQVALIAIMLVLLAAGVCMRLLRILTVPFSLILLVLALGLLPHVLDADNSHFLNTSLALITYSPALLLAFTPRLTRTHYEKFIVLSAWLAVGQAAIAAGQLLLGSGSIVFETMSAGDLAVGTLLTNSHLFVVKMLVLFLVLGSAAVVGLRRRVAIVGALAALFGAILGSALLALMATGVGLLLLLILFPVSIFGRKLTRSFRIFRMTAGTVLVAGFVFMAVTQPENVQYVLNTVSANSGSLIENALNDGGPGKVRSTGRTLRLLSEQPNVFLMGTGLGHYSSRAALILSGEYLTDHPRYIPISTSPYTSELITPLWNRRIWSTQFQDGVMNQPFYSMQSLAGEGGLLLGCVLIALYAWLWFAVLRRRYSDRVGLSIQLAGIVLLTVTPFLLFTDNWLEYPHAAISLLMPICFNLGMSATRPEFAEPAK